MVKIKIFKCSSLAFTDVESQFNQWASENPEYWVRTVNYKLEDFNTHRETLLVTYTEKRPTNNYDIEAMIG